jgi:hypothetical protein
MSLFASSKMPKGNELMSKPLAVRPAGMTSPVSEIHGLAPLEGFSRDWHFYKKKATAMG